MDDSMDISFLSDSSSKTHLSKETDATDGIVTYYNIPYKSAMIVLMNHPASLTIKKHVCIKVILGRVSVFGYEMYRAKDNLKVFSTKNTGLIKVKTEECENIWNDEGKLQNLRERINGITQHKERTQSILHKLIDSTAIIVIQLCAYPTNLQFLELYYPCVFKSNEGKVKTQKEFCIERSLSPIQFGLDEEKLAAIIHKKVLNENVNAPRIVVFGPKNTGKSTLIRYLINRIVSTLSIVYYLDTDPGQPEFTPPGVVSLSKVSKAVIGPSFCHQTDPVSMIFTGDISVSSPCMYSRSISRLMQLYTEKYKNKPLFVNTMGWMQGMGLECLKDAMTLVNPTIVVELVNEFEPSMFDYREYVSQDSIYHQISSSYGEKNSLFSPKEKREFSIISYLGKSLSPYEGVVPVNEIKPYCVPWDKIPVYIFNQKVQPWRMAEAISLSIVALCVVPTSAILVSTRPLFAMTLEDEPENECLGFGLVKAVDEKAKILHIVTPLEMYELKRVNAIMKGNIMVPDILISNQDIERAALNFLRDIREERSAFDEDKMTDSLSFMEISGEESSSPKNIKYDSAKCYRKSIPRRHKRRLYKCK